MFIFRIKSTVLQRLNKCVIFLKSLCNDSPTTSFEIIVNFLIYLIADIFFFLCQFYQKLIIFSSFKINKISSLNALVLLLFLEIDKTWILETVMFWLSWLSFLLSKSALIQKPSGQRVLSVWVAQKTNKYLGIQGGSQKCPCFLWQ